jgi:hypothetical protein
VENSVLERITAHSRPEERRMIEVPEWGTPAKLDSAGGEVEPAKPMVIRYSMVKLDDLSMLASLDGDDMYKRAARIICMKALDEQDRPIFTLLDALELRRVAAPEVLMRVALSMYGRLTAEDAEKN